MKLDTLILNEAKVTFRDTSDTRNNIFYYLIKSSGQEYNEKNSIILKDASKMNSIIAFVVQKVLKGKKGKNGKFTISSKDLEKLKTMKFTINDLSPTLAKSFKIAGVVGSNKYNSKETTETPKTTKSMETKTKLTVADMNKEVKKVEVKTADYVEEIKSLITSIGGSVSNNGSPVSATWEKEDRISARDAYRMAERNVPNALLKYFESNSFDSTDEEDPYHDSEWSDFAKWTKSESYKAKKEYSDKVSRLIIGGVDTGDYSGDYAEAYIKVVFK